MPVLGKTRKDVLSEFRRSELLVAARAIFSKKGFHEATIDDVAEAAQVAKGTVYLYYKSKRDLYLEALRYGIESLNRELEELLDAVGLDAVERTAGTGALRLDRHVDFQIEP